MARENFAFGEIDSAETQRWICKHGRYRDHPHRAGETLSRVSSTLGLFEPPDEKKGDVARAMFYFYTVYHTEAMSADSTFFERQRETLLRWNHTDPPDQSEKIRNERIERIQGNRNPFVDDTSLVSASGLSGVAQ